MRKAFLMFIVTACMMVTVVLAGPPRMVWNRVYDGGGTDWANGIAVDVSGNVYVTGSSKDSYDWIYRTIKYDTDGNLQWNKVYDADNDNWDLGNDVAVDALGNVYVIGTGITPNKTYYEYCTIKYDTDGNIQWNKVYNSGNSDQAGGVAVDVSGNVYVTGSSWNVSPCDYRTIKYDADGNLQWERTYGLYDNDDLVYGVAVDASNNVYVTGRSNGTTGADYCTIKYDTDGNLQWEKIYDSGDDDGARDVAVDASNNVYVTGYFYDEYNPDYRTIKYAQDDIPAVAETPTPSSLTLEIVENLSAAPRFSYVLPQGAKGTLAFYSADGRMVKEFALTASESTIDLNYPLPSGIYFAVLKAGSYSIATKLVLVR